jgi:hypothetical protein
VPRRLAIQIRKKLTKEQYLKLYSNPVSGIACDMNGAAMNDFMTYCIMVNVLNNIKYSKSMILKALEFWRNQMYKYHKKIFRIYNPLQGRTTNNIYTQIKEIIDKIELIIKLPDTFLFSHRHITPIQPNNYTSGMRQQSKLLSNKYEDIFFFQEGTLQPYKPIKTSIGIEFTVFPCEHPYIEKQKISKVGITEKGNVYILHDREKNKK